MNNTKKMTTSTESFEPKRLTMTAFEDNKKGPKSAWLRYNHPSLGEDTSLQLQTPWIVLSSGGIPRFNPDYHKGDKDRAFLRLPVEEGTDFFKKMTSLDDQFTSDEFKQEKFGKHWKKYSMFPIVRIPDNDEDDDREPRPPTMKIKFDLVWNEDDPDACDIKTQVFTSKLLDSGKRERTLEDGKTLDNMEKYVRLGSKLRLIIRPSKAWCSAKKEYGVIWKVLKMEVEPNPKNNSLMKAYYEADAFLDSDDSEDEVELPKETKKSTKKFSNDDSESDNHVKSVFKAADDSDESDESDESDDSESDSPDIPVKRKSKSKGRKSLL